jgi:hypothetical protein
MEEHGSLRDAAEAWNYWVKRFNRWPKAWLPKVRGWRRWVNRLKKENSEGEA